MEERSLRRAVDLMVNAKTLVVHSGSGMGADSGLPTFRGSEGFWRAYPQLRASGRDLQALVRPSWFDDDPELAWGFFLHRLRMYRSATPHPGYEILTRWAKSRQNATMTSNVDGHHRRPPAADGPLYEVHGSLQHVQCVGPCVQRVWPMPRELPSVGSDLRAVGELPRCLCGRLLRPNVMMFGDWTFVTQRADEQAQQYLGAITKPKEPVVVVEIGAGEAIPTIREQSARLVARGAQLIRINPSQTSIFDGHVALKTTGLEALTVIDKRLTNQLGRGS